MKTNKELSVLFDQLNYDWMNLYQSDIVKRKSYTEFVSSLILKHFDKIKWVDKGLRKQNFKIKKHIGVCNLQTSIKQITEKRFCYALYNSGKFELFGKVIDYEIPLTEPNQGIDKKNHGKIDFISVKQNEIYFFEAKANSNESVLRAILEIYVYLFRLIKYNRLKTLINDYGNYQKVIPAVILFHNTLPEKQLQKLEDHPNLLLLLNKINKTFNYNGISKIRCFSTDISKCINENILKQENGIIKFNKQPTIEEIVY